MRRQSATLEIWALGRQHANANAGWVEMLGGRHQLLLQRIVSLALAQHCETASAAGEQYGTEYVLAAEMPFTAAAKSRAIIAPPNHP